MNSSCDENDKMFNTTRLYYYLVHRARSHSRTGKATYCTRVMISQSIRLCQAARRAGSRTVNDN